MSWVDDALGILYVLLALSVIVSLFGIVNTLVLSVFERRRELGMLRAVGMTRRQVRRMVRHESVITALIGAALGVGVGLVLRRGSPAFGDQGLAFAVPVGSLVAFAVVALAGVLAAVLPARRAARLDPLTALAYESVTARRRARRLPALRFRPTTPSAGRRAPVPFSRDARGGRKFSQRHLEVRLGTSGSSRSPAR